MGTNEPVAPASLLQVAGTGCIVREKSLEALYEAAEKLAVADASFAALSGYIWRTMGGATRRLTATTV